MRSFYNILFFIIFISWIHGNKIAVTTKVKGQVEIMPIGKDNFANLKQRLQYKYPEESFFFAGSPAFAKWPTMVATLSCVLPPHWFSTTNALRCAR